MKRILLPFLLILIVKANAQLLSWKPEFIQESTNADTIIMDANYGNHGLFNYTPTSDVYVYTGVITNFSTDPNDWQHVKHADFNSGYPDVQCTYLGNNRWRYIINGGLRNFYGITNSSETIKKIAILFKNGAGTEPYIQRNADGSDMYIPVYDNGLYARIDVPYQQPLYNPMPEPQNYKVGDLLNITIKASQISTINIYYDTNKIAYGSGSSLSADTNLLSTGVHYITAYVTNSVSEDTLDQTITVFPANNVAQIPAGDTDGINYEKGDTSAVLVLYAPKKQNIVVIGDFNNWQILSDYLMNVTPDGNRFWIRVTGLIPGAEYAYQYLIDGTLKVADYNCEKILDPDNDQYISSATYPNLKTYPTGKTTGIVSVLQTKKTAYTWQVNNFSRPDKQNLVIYELLVKDFTAAGNFQTLTDTLSYLQRLGVNAIEVMPFNEFEGNISWGYNPSFYFAPDKAYGPENAVKKFIDECHKRGIAVIMDIVLNHSYGQSPMVQMYYDAANNRPAADNPWYNAVAPTAFGFGNDFNHESAATKYFFDRVLNHWITQYKIDGYRFDFSKGLTQKHSSNDAEFSAYDPSRIAIINNYADSIWKTDNNTYVILEHFCDNSEEKELSNDGMLLWGNLNGSYNQATMGYRDYFNGSNWDFKYGIYTYRGWTNPNLVTYQESHDEERLMFKNEQYGASSGTYNVKNIPTGLARNGMAAAFWAMQPGPKMLWEFGELGYDYSRCYLATNGDGGDCNTKTDPKPIRWDYYNNPDRKALYDVYANLIHLKTYSSYASTFINGSINYNLADTIKWENLAGSDLQVMVFGNFGINASTATVTFPSTGKWYSFLTAGNITISSTAYLVTLQPGEYYVYTNKDVKAQVLAVNWLSFTAQKNGTHSVLLNWQTQSESNNDRYEIERSSDGISFTKIGSINTLQISGIQKYSFTDNQPLATNYYRIKQVDKDGSAYYSPTRKISLNDAVKYWSLYPNPAKNNTSLYALNNYNKADISVSDFNGRIIYRIILNNIIANQQIQIPLLQLSKGVYIIKISTEQNTETQKLIVE